MKEAVKVVVVAALAGGLFQSGPARAEDERGRWSFAIGLGMHSTFDDIRSNAAEVISIENDPTKTRLPDGDLSNDKVVTYDPRQDDELGRATKVEEKQRFDFSAAYGLTSWLSLQVDTGMYQGDVAPLEVLKMTERWVIPVPTADNSKIDPTTEFQSVPITVGRLTQIPFSVNAVVRFRRDSPFNPFLGLGVGYMFNSLKVNDSFNGLNNDILRGFSRIISVLDSSDSSKNDLVNLQEIYSGFIASENSSSEAGGAVNIVYDVDCTNVPSDTGTPGITNTCTPQDVPERYAALPTQPFIHTDVQDGFLYQVSVGADYHLNERWSAYVSARYLVTDSKVSVRIEGTDPRTGPFNLQEATFRYTAETNPPTQDRADNGYQVCQPPGAGCTDPSIARPAPGTLQERVLVQGGDIGLSAFTLGAGIRFTF
jgi:opacity protein-like surface antigen